MTCITCEITRAKVLAQIMMLGKPRHSAPAWKTVVDRLNQEFGTDAHSITEIEGEFWLVRLHPVTHVPIKLKRAA